MGDVIHTLPAAQALRQSFSQRNDRVAHRRALGRTSMCARNTAARAAVGAASIGGLGSRRQPDRVGKSLSSISTLQQIARTWNDVRSVHYDVAVDLQGAIKVGGAGPLVERTDGLRLG